MGLRLATLVVLLAAGCENNAQQDAASHVAPEPSVTAVTDPMPQDIPEPITVEEVAAMDLAEAEKVYRHLSYALQQGYGDEATKKRLWDEWKMIRTRVREIRTAGGT